MIGKHHVKVRNREAVFEFDLYRNITIVRGNSGTGKTTLFEMIADHTRLKESSGVNISCDKECVALTDIDWKKKAQITIMLFSIERAYMIFHTVLRKSMKFRRVESFTNSKRYSNQTVNIFTIEKKCPER